jgi:tetratricopeptide (TPR) repeat protein
MASLLSGFEYDIFVSYRRKDNKGDRWVSEFVSALKTELEATFKEDISVYFDENPHDHLHETYVVEKSLEGKLKCLIFIPILSQTYCDPNSYAWQHEFLAFNRIAEDDRFGRYVKLKNGNVAFRILPVRIHDLDPDDIKLFEQETGSVIRALDFVFKTSSGVNRPLRANEDHPNDNLNKTFYRDQVNKVANAIKEILQGIKAESTGQNIENAKQIEQLAKKDEIKPEGQKTDVILTKKNLLAWIIIAAIIGIIILFYQIVFSSGKQNIHKDQDGRISIAVNTFDNLTGDTVLNSWRLGIAELLIYNLGTSKELAVQNSQTMVEVYQSMGQTQNASMAPSLSHEAAKKLKTGAYVTGNFQKTGKKIRIIVKLINTDSDEVLWTGKVDGDIYANYIDMADSLSQQVKNFLEIKALEKNTSLDFRIAYTNSADAYRKYIEGMQSYMNGYYERAIESLQEAFRIDTTFTMAAFNIAIAYNIIAATTNSQAVLQAVSWTRKAYLGKERLPEEYRHWVEMWGAWYIKKNPSEVLNFCTLLEKSDIKSRFYWYDIGITYQSGFEMWDKAASMFGKIEDLNTEWKEDWKFKEYYTQYGYACRMLGKYDKAVKIYETGLTLYPDYGPFVFGQAVCAALKGDSALATELIVKRIELARKDGWTESYIAGMLGYLYSSAGLLEKAEQNYRRALQLDPHNPDRMNILGNFLINKERDIDINEGIGLIDSALKVSPDARDPLWSKGYVLYKQGKYSDALVILLRTKDHWMEINPKLDKLIQNVRDSLARQK